MMVGICTTGFLGTIYYKDKDVNLEMVAEGGAWVYYTNKDPAYLEAQSAAKSAKKSLWRSRVSKTAAKVLNQAEGGWGGVLGARLERSALGDMTRHLDHIGPVLNTRIAVFDKHRFQELHEALGEFRVVNSRIVRFAIRITLSANRIVDTEIVE